MKLDGSMSLTHPAPSSRGLAASALRTRCAGVPTTMTTPRMTPNPAPSADRSTMTPANGTHTRRAAAHSERPLARFLVSIPRSTGRPSTERAAYCSQTRPARGRPGRSPRPSAASSPRRTRSSGFTPPGSCTGSTSSCFRLGQRPGYTGSPTPHKAGAAPTCAARNADGGRRWPVWLPLRIPAPRCRLSHMGFLQSASTRLSVRLQSVRSLRSVGVRPYRMPAARWGKAAPATASTLSRSTHPATGAAVGAHPTKTTTPPASLARLLLCAGPHLPNVLRRRIATDRTAHCQSRLARNWPAGRTTG